MGKCVECDMCGDMFELEGKQRLLECPNCRMEQGPNNRSAYGNREGALGPTTHIAEGSKPVVVSKIHGSHIPKNCVICGKANNNNIRRTCSDRCMRIAAVRRNQALQDLTTRQNHEVKRARWYAIRSRSEGALDDGTHYKGREYDD